MNGKRHFRESIEMDRWMEEDCRRAEEELTANAEAGARMRGSRFVRSSAEFEYVRKGDGMEVWMEWTEIFGGET